MTPDRWDIRVVRSREPGGSIVLALHEVMVDREGKVCAVATKPMAPRVVESDGESVNELAEVVGWLVEAVKKPVVELDDVVDVS